jgi:glycosyltransferase involved in cell wall biosynthesis
MTKNIVFIGPFGLRPKATMSIRAVPLAKALAAQGHRVTVLIPPWDDPEQAGQTWAEDGVQVVNVSLPQGVLRLPLLFHIFLTRTLVTHALSLQPDVIHFFKPKAYAGLAHVWLWWQRRRGRTAARLVVDTDDWEQAWNDMLPYSTLQKKFFTWQEQWGLRHADAVTVASRALKNLVAAQIKRQPTDILYVPNGIHAQASMVEPGQTSQGQTSPSLIPFTSNAPIILLYSRFVEFRLARIINMVKQVADQLPPARWLIVGEGLQGEDKILAQQLAAANLSSFVHFTGWLPIEQVPACFDAADVAIYPYDDTLLNRTKCSVKLISLLTAGLPVVADAVGQNCEYIESGVSGILVPAEDDDAFSRAIVSLLEQSGIRQMLGQNAARRMEEQYSWSKLAEIAERAYH